MKLPTFYFVSHKGRGFVYRVHYTTTAELNAAAFDVHKLTGCNIRTDVRIPAPKLVFVKRRGKYPALHLINQRQVRAFAV